MPQFRVRNVEQLNVRSEPKLVADNIIGVLKRDETVEQLAVSGTEYWYKVRRAADRLEGWASHKYLFPVVDEGLLQGADPPWLEIALGELGVKAFPGTMNANPRILAYLQSTTLPAPLAQIDETFWCSAFVNWCVEQAGHEGTDSAMARSWSTWGSGIDQPSRGCIVVFERSEGGPNAGHVGFFMGSAGDSLSVLGGNQNDAVNIGHQPRERLIASRVLR
jgi:uncharacterized protein (TIGR02594 family)